MASILDIRRMGSILERKSRGRIWNNKPDTPVHSKNKKKLKKKIHIKKNWSNDLWD